MRDSTPSGDRYLRVRQILELFPVSRSGFYNLVNAGKMPRPALRLGSRCTMWRESEVRAAIDALTDRAG
jgi:predicted DNA-binding transcriptional regulator AlpA